MGFNISDLDFGIQQEFHLMNQTKKFLKFLKSEATDIDFSFMSLTFGSPGTGKTAFAFMLFCAILRNDKRWTVGFWKCPAGFIAIVKKHAPEEIREKFFEYHKLREIPPFTILVVDEGAVTFNAKEALKKEAVKFEKFLALTRQRHMIVIMNSQVANIMRVYRRMAQFRFYKQMTFEDLRESKDDEFIMEFGLEISRLEREKIIFTTNYRKFNEEGYLWMELQDYCPWYCDEISKSYENTSADLDFDETIKLNPIIHDIAEVVVAALGEMVIEAKGDKLMRSWLRNNRPDIYTDYKTLLPDVYTECVLILKTDPRFAAPDENEPAVVAEESIENEDVPLSRVDEKINNDLAVATDQTEDIFDVSFSDYCYHQLVKQDERAAILVRMFLEGYTQLDIADKLDCSEGLVNGIWQKIREKVIGYYFESWVSFQLGGDGKTAKAEHIPDFIDEFGNIFTIKWRYDRKRNVSFSQEEDFSPEYDEAKRSGKNLYFLVLLNIHWKGNNQIKIIPIHCGDDDKVLVWREDKSMLFKHFRKGLVTV